MDERNTQSRQRSGNATPTTIHLRSVSATELQLSIRCDDPEQLSMYANWLDSETRGIKAVVSELAGQSVNIQHDNYFDRVAKAA